jgi:hypothetical protein
VNLLTPAYLNCRTCTRDTNALTISDAEFVSKPGARPFVDSPNRNSVAESIVNKDKNGWRSTVEPPRDIAHIERSVSLKGIKVGDLVAREIVPDQDP